MDCEGEGDLYRCVRDPEMIRPHPTSTRGGIHQSSITSGLGQGACVYLPGSSCNARPMAPDICEVQLERRILPREVGGAGDSMLAAQAALPDGPTHLPHNQPPHPLTAVVSGEAGSWTRAMPATASGGELSAAGCTPGTVRRRGGYNWTAGSNWRPSPSASRQRRPRYDEPVAGFRDPPDLGAGDGRTTAAHHPH